MKKENKRPGRLYRLAERQFTKLEEILLAILATVLFGFYGLICYMLFLCLWYRQYHADILSGSVSDGTKRFYTLVFVVLIFFSVTGYLGLLINNLNW